MKLLLHIQCFLYVVHFNSLLAPFTWSRILFAFILLVLSIFMFLDLVRVRLCIVFNDTTVLTRRNRLPRGCSGPTWLFWLIFLLLSELVQTVESWFEYLSICIWNSGLNTALCSQVLKALFPKQSSLFHTEVSSFESVVCLIFIHKD